jgi:hypothetical protein
MKKTRDIETRFADVIDMWEEAFRSGGGQIVLETDNLAIHTMLKMHRARQLLRTRDGESRYDLYVLQRRGNVLNVVTRPRIKHEFIPAWTPEDLVIKEDLNLEEE